MENEIIILGEVSGHPSGPGVWVGSIRDEADQSQTYFGHLEGSDFVSDDGSYVCQVSNWDDPRSEVLAGLHLFPGFGSLAWVG